MRILNIVENLDKGAVENWLVQIFLNSRQFYPDWKWTFYCILGKPGRLDEQVRKAGGEIIYSPVSISNKFAFLRHFRKLLKAKCFDIIHSHHDYLSGFYLLSTIGIKFKKRILHIHNTDKALPTTNKLMYGFLLKLFKKIAVHYSDFIIGISRDTLNEFTGREGAKKRYRVLYYGVDLSRFEQSADPIFFRKELQLPADSQLLLFVGRMNQFKNPVFVVDILHEITKLYQNVFAVFVGAGDEQTEVRKRAESLQLASRIRILGWREDIASILKCCDVFVFPRVEYPKEGLGLVVVEAQAAGLPLLISRGIVEEAIIVKELVDVVPLEDNPDEWAAKAISILQHKTPLNRREALQAVKGSHFELKTATLNLLKIYRD